MSRLGRLSNKISLRHLIFLLLLVSGMIPLAIGSYLLTSQNIEILQTQEQDYLTHSAQVLSDNISEYLATVKVQLEQLGEGLLVLPGPPTVKARLADPNVQQYFGNFLLNNQGKLRALSALDINGVGPSLGAGKIGDEVIQALNRAFEEARKSGHAVYDFVRTDDNQPLAALAVPIFDPLASQGASPPNASGKAAADGGQKPMLILTTAIELDLLQQVFRREAQGEVSVFLIDPVGNVLWTEGADDQSARALASSSLVQQFKAKPLNLASEYYLYVYGKKQHMLGRVSPVKATGWGVVVQKPLSAAYVATQRLVYSATISSGVLILLAMAFGAVAARRFSSPIQHLAETTHQIAAGNFGRRVEVTGPGREVAELASDFNQMSNHVQGYVERLKEAAQANRELFIGSIRAFAAAVDAKDPYTRGHSERVAGYSRTISGYLGLNEDFQQRIWIAGVLHDVGKIGIEDRILKKGGVLTSEEYEQMKLHPVIGYDILLPLEPLKEMLPAIRWHHEAWNGRGYPDGLKGEGIPLIARIVAVADTFDAITTNRPYQKAYTPEYAVETITKLTGARFDAKVVTAFLRAFQESSIRVEVEEPEEGRQAVQVGA